MLAGLDLALKGWAAATLRPGRVEWIARPLLGLDLIRNTGATLGLGRGHPLLWAVLTGLGSVVLAVFLLRGGAGAPGLTLMLAGALGNLGSRILGGSVIDFIRVAWWPGIFNLADVFLRLGALWVVVALWSRSRRRSRSPQD